MLLLNRFQPIFPLLSPPLIIFVPSIFNKVQVLPIGNQHGTRFKFIHIELPLTKLVVPAIHIHFINWSFPWKFPTANLDHLIHWYFAQVFLFTRALDKRFDMFDHGNGHLSHNNRRGFKVHKLVLNPHEHHPPLTPPTLHHFILYLLNHSQHHIPNWIPILLHFLYLRPVVVTLIEIVPVHLINSNRKHSLIGWVHPFVNNTRINQPVDVEYCGVSEIEDKWMSKSLSFDVVCLVR